MSDVLSRNSRADQFHQAGLEAMTGGDFVAARNMFGEATGILSGVDVTIDSLVQRAQIVRHSGYAYMRQATEEFDVSLLDSARSVLGEAVTLTAPLVSGTAFVGADVAASPYKKTPKGIRREIAGEHGKALSLIAREVTARNVVVGFDSRGDSEEAVENRDERQQPYGLAYDYLWMARDGRSLVEHSMFGGRQEVLNGRMIKTLPWLERALRGIAGTAIRGGDFKQASATFRRGWAYLEDYEAARASVLLDP